MNIFLITRASAPTHTYARVVYITYNTSARLAQMVERMTLNHVVAGSIPAVGVIYMRSYGAIGSASDSRPEGWGFESL